MAVYHEFADISILGNTTFEKVSDPKEAFNTESLFEITIENGLTIEHKIENYSDLLRLIDQGVNIYRELIFNNEIL